MKTFKKHPGLVLFCICAVFMTVDLISRGEYAAAVWPTLAALFDYFATSFSDMVDELLDHTEELQGKIEKLQEENERLRREQRDWYA